MVYSSHNKAVWHRKVAGKAVKKPKKATMGWRDEWESPVMGKMNQELGGDFNGLSLKKLKRRLTHGAELDEVLCALTPLLFSRDLSHP